MFFRKITKSTSLPSLDDDEKITALITSSHPSKALTLGILKVFGEAAKLVCKAIAKTIIPSEFEDVIHQFILLCPQTEKELKDLLDQSYEGNPQFIVILPPTLDIPKKDARIIATLNTNVAYFSNKKIKDGFTTILSNVITYHCLLTQAERDITKINFKHLHTALDNFVIKAMDYSIRPHKHEKDIDLAFAKLTAFDSPEDIEFKRVKAMFDDVIEEKSLYVSKP